ncbi:unnamed protein product [Acanthoscelides obtectus]|uniref:FYVE-type domain-containing protein n=1 Tax=Acanthoscelides obtectus TaxID=200917 RepID=A0A9P0JWF7_ACAOB|nr:unnamed protein product [Acanthoscelides obtectus]CAK1649040.1 Abscission/NoCut checkpoint regulator [Acanthoscelides obtectus]
MSCNQCGIKYNFFHKEMGCSSCKRSFCGKCLNQKLRISPKGHKEPVCKGCYLKLQAGSSDEAPQPIIPPDTFFKRWENLENPTAKPPITVYKQDRTNQNQSYFGLSKADIELMKRLEKLKDNGDQSKSLPTDAEIRARLSQLKGDNHYTEEPVKGKVLYPTDSRSDPEKVDSLLEQFVKEKEIEITKDPTLEGIEARLATLRDQGVRPNEGPYVRELHDGGSDEESGNEEREVDKLTRKIMDEVAMDDRNHLKSKSKWKKDERDETSDEDPEMTDDDDEDSTTKPCRDCPELPWCVLCNNDATYRCTDCTGDLYCDECNREVHRNWGENDHKVVPYRRK